jgi:hypothetical protein
VQVERPRESAIDHLVAIIRKGAKATVFINELDIIGVVRAKGGVSAGDPVSKDDIANIHAVEFAGLDLPADAGLY